MRSFKLQSVTAMFFALLLAVTFCMPATVLAADTSSQPASSTAAPAKASGGDTGTADSSLSCEIKFTGPLTWIICPVVDLLVVLIEQVDKVITDQMTIETSDIFCDNDPTCQAYKTAWSSFRNIALGLMVVVGLIILISQAIGLEVLDAYTVRKTLPRLLVAAVAITLSWSIMRLLVQLSNDLGFGIQHLIYAPFSELNASLNLNIGSVGSLLAVGGTAAAGAEVGTAAFSLFLLAGGPGALIAYLGTAALAVLVAVIVLALRQIVIILLILLAPIAIIAYVLPNTQRYYKLWWESFSKALLMFPMIAGLIALGRVFSAIAIHNGGAINQLIGFIAYFAPYFIIPLTVKFAGGALRQIGGFVNDRSTGGFDRLREYRKGRRQAGTQRILSGNTWKGADPDSKKGQLNRSFQAAGLGLTKFDEMGIKPKQWKGNATALRERADIVNALQGYEKSEAFHPIQGDDDAHRAALAGNRTRESAKQWLDDNTDLTDDEKARKLNHIEFARNQMGQTAFLSAAIIGQSGTTTGYKGGYKEVVADIDRVAGDDENLRNNLIGAVKKSAEGANRGDLSPSFSNAIGHSRNIARARAEAGSDLNAQESARVAASNAIAREVRQNIVDTHSAGWVLSQKGQALENLLPEVRDRVTLAAETLHTAELSGDETQIKTAKRAFMQSLASTAAMHDVAQSVSPEAGKLFVDNILDFKLPSIGGVRAMNADGTPAMNADGTPQGVTIQQYVGASKQDAEFQQLHKEYQDIYSEQARHQGEPGGGIPDATRVPGT